MLNRLLGQDVSARAERCRHSALKRDRRTINGKIRLLARLGDALLTASVGRRHGAVVEAVVGWDDLGREVDEARKLIRPRCRRSRYDRLHQLPRPPTGRSLVHRLVHVRSGPGSPYARASSRYHARPSSRSPENCRRIRRLPSFAAWRRAIGPGIPDRREFMNFAS